MFFCGSQLESYAQSLMGEPRLYAARLSLSLKSYTDISITSMRARSLDSFAVVSTECCQVYNANHIVRVEVAVEIPVGRVWCASIGQAEGCQVQDCYCAVAIYVPWNLPVNESIISASVVGDVILAWKKVCLGFYSVIAWRVPQSVPSEI